MPSLTSILRCMYCYRHVLPNQTGILKSAIPKYFCRFLFPQMCTDERLSDRTLYPTFSRTVPPISGLAPPLHALMKHFKWTRVGLIVQTTQQWSQWNALERGLRGGGLVVGIVRTMTFGVHYNVNDLVPEFEGLLQSTAKESRGKFHRLLWKMNSIFLFTFVYLVETCRSLLQIVEFNWFCHR